MKPEDVDKGRPLAVDQDAVSTDPSLPAFIARPAGAPAYYGFPVVTDITIDGFMLGMITDFEREPSIYGDAYVVAPDGSRAGLVWEVAREAYVTGVRDPEPTRWGVWGVGFPASYPEPMATREQARQNLAAILSPGSRSSGNAGERLNYRNTVVMNHPKRDSRLRIEFCH